MNELSELLNAIEDAYFDFVSAMLHYAGKNEARRNALLGYLKKNPEAKSSDVVKYVSEQSDFYEDAAYVQG